VVDALADAGVRSKLADLGQGIFPRDQQTPEAHGARHKAEIEKWWPIIRAAGIKVERGRNCHQLEIFDLVDGEHIGGPTLFRNRRRRVVK
jgi:hypothetical protein